jgi:hypothetical protein
MKNYMKLYIYIYNLCNTSFWIIIYHVTSRAESRFIFQFILINQNTKVLRNTTITAHYTKSSIQSKTREKGEKRKEKSDTYIHTHIYLSIHIHTDIDKDGVTSVWKPIIHYLYLLILKDTSGMICNENRSFVVFSQNFYTRKNPIYGRNLYLIHMWINFYDQILILPSHIKYLSST